MPVPAVITDMFATIGSNFPLGTDSAQGTIDDYLRAHAGFIRQLSDQAQASTAIVAIAAGTADALTAAFSPTPITALTAGLTVIVRAASANATATPTFKADGTLAKIIVKGNNLPLVAGDISGAGHWITLTYDTTLTAWVLENPVARDTLLRADLAASTGAALVGGGDQVVSSISGLRALLKTSASKNAIVTGYYAAGDGGGGAYWYDSADTTTADNGGTIIVATDGGRWKLRLISAISVKQFGAKGDGITDDTASFASATLAIPAGGTLMLRSGDNYSITNWDVSGKIITVSGYGATITSNTVVNGAIKKTDHAFKLVVLGIKFVGVGMGIKYVTTTSSVMFDEFSAIDCRFENADYGIYMDGARESQIMHCWFNGVTNKGIFRVRSINTNVGFCGFKDTVFGINDAGDNTPFSAGLLATGCVMLGCATGIYTNEADTMTVVNCLIDYCDTPISINGTYPVVIADSYITSRTTNPCIYVNTGIGHSTVPQQINIHDNIIVSHGAVITADCLSLNNIAVGFVRNNMISFFWRTGVDFAFCTDLKIEGNYFAVDPASTAATKLCIHETGAGNSSSNAIKGNVFSSPAGSGALTAGSYTSIASNRGFLTKASGEALPGTGVTSVVVAHGLNYTPIKADVTLTPTTANLTPFIFAVDGTNLTIGFTVGTPAGSGVKWDITKFSAI